MDSTQQSLFESYMDDSIPFKRIMFFNGLISCLVNLFVVMLILRKTPPAMKVYRIYLLNIALWSGLFDVYMGIFYAPQLVFPATSMCVNGFLNLPDSLFLATTSFCIFVILMGGTGMSVFSAFLYRLSTVADKQHWIHRKGMMSLLIGAHVIYTLPTCILLFLVQYWDVEGVKQDMIQNHLAVYQFSHTHSCFYFSWSKLPVLTSLFFAFALFEIVLCILVVLALRVLVMRKIDELKPTMSSKTFKLHHQLNNSLSIQFGVPEVFLVVPFTVIIGLILTGNNGTRFAAQVGHSLMVFSSMHSLFNAFSMIIFTGPYRRACLAPLKAFSRSYVQAMEQRRGTIPTADVHTQKY